MAITIDDIKPTGDRILVKRVDDAQDTTDGGVIIPDTAQKAGDRATVVHVGEGAVVDGKRVPIEITVGTDVLIARYAGTEVVVGDTSYLIMRVADVLGVYED